MSTDKKNTNEPEVKEVQEIQVEAEVTEPEVQSEQVKEETINEVFNTEEKKSSKPDTVPLDTFLATDKANRELRKQIKELQEKIDNGATEEEVSSDIDSIADEFNVDKSFLSKLEKAMELKFEARVSEKLRPFEEREKSEKVDNVFNTYYEKAIEKLPEYKGVVNKNVIKTLSLQGENGDKTISQIIEETYGNALGGRRTIETTTPRGGEGPKTVDFDRAAKDPSYFTEVMEDPDLKEKYNENLAQRVLR